MNFRLITILFYFTYISGKTNGKSYPVLEFSPRPKSESTLIWYSRHKNSTKLLYKNSLENFLKPYLSETKSQNAVDCQENELPPKNKFCRFQINRYMAPCLSDYGYRFETNSGPCVFLRLTQIPNNWRPEFYNSINLPTVMPSFLQNSIKYGDFRKPNKKIWVMCEGENPADIENIGPTVYFPQAGFSENSLLNSHIEGYLGPLVAVFFEHPTRGILINIRCTAWAKNLPRDPTSNLGTVHFELLVDN